MEFVIWALIVLFVLFTTLGIVVTVRTARAVRRGVERTSSQVRRTVEDTALKARTAQPGPVGEAARIRLELRASFDSTRAALESGASDDPGLREAAALLEQLHGHARRLDEELRLLTEREPDRERIAARLPEARERAASLRRSSDSLRFAAQDRAREYDADSLDALRNRIEIESGALRGFREPPAGTPGALRGEAGQPGRRAVHTEDVGSERAEPEAIEQHWSRKPTLPRNGPSAGAGDRRTEQRGDARP
ncbi:hypothetical protein [Streptomyces sp. TR06-5]|uniref:hypothetical protein n=1 Tax=unclassified Streptomyces TaxID=2593676 RepID=UPI0039A0BF0B